MSFHTFLELIGGYAVFFAVLTVVHWLWKMLK